MDATSLHVQSPGKESQHQSLGRDSKVESLQLAIRDLENKLALALQHNANMYALSNKSNAPSQTIGSQVGNIN